jgi:PhoPQ-activated pathogenicity-related protein
MVIDMLNMPEHMRLQITSWGKPSDQIHDYIDRGIHLHVGDERGRKLIQLVDPYAYRQRLKQPKFIILGTNDRYWPLESLNNYWPELLNEKFVTYVPNNGHGLRDFARVIGTVVAAHRHGAGELTMPKLSWDYRDVDAGLELTVKSDRPPASVLAWTTAAKTRDFREALWSAKQIDSVDGVYRYVLPKPAEGYDALFGEARFDDEVMPYYLSTTVRVVGASK